MPFDEANPRLIDVMALMTLKMVVKTQGSGGRYISAWDYFTALGFQYESGAILGRARRDRVNVLAEMLGPEKTADEFEKDVQEAASNRLNQYRNEVGRDPPAFHDLVSIRERDKMLAAMGYSWTKLLEEWTRGNKGLMKEISEHKAPLEVALGNLGLYTLEGIGFGSSFPELTESMYKNVSENIDPGGWAEARARGLNIPEKPGVVPFKEREESILGIVAAFATQFYPELVDILELRGFLDKK